MDPKRVSGVRGVLAAGEWEIGLDGEPLRTEFGLQRCLAHFGYHRNPSETFGANHSLADSVILGLRNAGYVRRHVTWEERRSACTAVRTHLVECHEVPSDGPPNMAVHEQIPAVFNFFASTLPVSVGRYGANHGCGAHVHCLRPFQWPTGG